MIIPDSQKGSHPANMVSTLKYGLLKDILRMGFHVLVADMDLVFLDNPFNHLYRDCDIESQTDGFSAEWCASAPSPPWLPAAVADVSVTQRALSVTQRALSVTQQGELLASPSELLASPSKASS
jgi:hypothetical protein